MPIGHHMVLASSDPVAKSGSSFSVFSPALLPIRALAAGSFVFIELEA